MRIRILKYFAAAPIPEHGVNAPHGYSCGEELDVPTPVAQRWITVGLAAPVAEVAMVAAPETTARTTPKPRKATRR